MFFFCINIPKTNPNATLIAIEIKLILSVTKSPPISLKKLWPLNKTSIPKSFT